MTLRAVESVFQEAYESSGQTIEFNVKLLHNLIDMVGTLHLKTSAAGTTAGKAIIYMLSLAPFLEDITTDSQ